MICWSGATDEGTAAGLQEIIKYGKIIENKLNFFLKKSLLKLCSTRFMGWLRVPDIFRFSFSVDLCHAVSHVCRSCDAPN